MGRLRIVPRPRVSGARLLVAAALVLLLPAMWLCTRFTMPTSGKLVRSAPHAFSGDEPHYEMVVHSILFDHDLSLAPDYDRVRTGSLRAGGRFMWRDLDHHTIVFEPATGRHALRSDIDGFAGASCRTADCATLAMLARAHWPGLVERSAHPIAFPLFLASWLAVFGVTPRGVEPGIFLVLLFAGWAGAIGTYLVARRAGASSRDGLLAAALLALASPWLAYSRGIFSEEVAGVALVLGLLALQAGRPGWAALGAGFATWIKPALVLVAVGWLIERLLARRFRDALVFALVMGACGGALLGFNYALTGTPMVGGQQGWFFTAGVRSAMGTFIDGRYGLLPFVPWSLLAFGGMATALVPHPKGDRLMIQIAIPVALSAVLLMLFGSLGANCYGCRYWVPLLPFLSLAAVRLLESVRPWGRPAFVATAIALGATAAAAAVIAVPGAMQFDRVWDRRPFVAAHQMIDRSF